MFKRSIILFLTFFCISAFATEPMRFSVPNFPPYSYSENGKLKGEAIEKMTLVFKQANIPVVFELTETYGRALHNIVNDKADGMFLATQNSSRDMVAQFSEPVTFNNWVWFIAENYEHPPSSSQFKTGARVGTILATNTHKWLLKNSYNVSPPPTDVQNLVKMFIKGRYDAIFMAEKVFEQEAKNQNLSESSYQKVVQIKRPFGVYVSKSYLNQFPDTLDKINDAIKIVNGGN